MTRPKVVSPTVAPRSLGPNLQEGRGFDPAGAALGAPKRHPMVVMGSSPTVGAKLLVESVSGTDEHNNSNG